MAKDNKATASTGMDSMTLDEARKLHGTTGRLFIRNGDTWMDTETGAVGDVVELAVEWVKEQSR